MRRFVLCPLGIGQRVDRERQQTVFQAGTAEGLRRDAFAGARDGVSAVVKDVPLHRASQKVGAAETDGGLLCGGDGRGDSDRGTLCGARGRACGAALLFARIDDDALSDRRLRDGDADVPPCAAHDQGRWLGLQIRDGAERLPGAQIGGAPYGGLHAGGGCKSLSPREYRVACGEDGACGKEKFLLFPVGADETGDARKVARKADGGHIAEMLARARQDGLADKCGNLHNDHLAIYPMRSSREGGKFFYGKRKFFVKSIENRLINFRIGGRIKLR